MTVGRMSGAFLLAAMAHAGQWSDLPPLPAATSGQFAGVSRGALIVIGGSSFDKPPYNGGEKHWLDTIFVLEPGALQWRTFHAPRAMAYGGSVTWKDSLILAGGSDGKTNFRDVRRLAWERGAPVFSALPSLPVPLANCEAVLDGDRLFVFGGQQSPAATAASNALFALDLSHPENGWRTLSPLPGPGRILPVFAAAGHDLYVFGGAELTPAGRRYLTDGWRWSHDNRWTPAPRPPFAMVAAPALTLANGKILVIGGDDGANADRIAELRERHPGFSKTIHEFHPAAGKWTALGEAPAGLVTTTAVLWRNRVVIPGGEDRPGHRSARVLSWIPE